MLSFLLAVKINKKQFKNRIVEISSLHPEWTNFYEFIGTFTYVSVIEVKRICRRKKNRETSTQMFPLVTIRGFSPRQKIWDHAVWNEIIFLLHNAAMEAPRFVFRSIVSNINNGLFKARKIHATNFVTRCSQSFDELYSWWEFKCVFSWKNICPRWNSLR